MGWGPNRVGKEEASLKKSRGCAGRGGKPVGVERRVEGDTAGGKAAGRRGTRANGRDGQGRAGMKAHTVQSGGRIQPPTLTPHPPHTLHPIHYQTPPLCAINALTCNDAVVDFLISPTRSWMHGWMVASWYRV